MSRRSVHRALVALSAVALMAWAAAPARAQGLGQTADETTYITFSQPVSLPGVTLPAGTYLFRHLPPGLTSHRHVVQVLSRDRKQIYATLLAIPNQRLEPSGKPFVLFKETPATAPAAVLAWFYPGDPIGDEFVYPPEQARKIAELSHEPVLSSPAVAEPGQTVAESTEQEAKTLEQAPVSRTGEQQMAEAEPQQPLEATPHPMHPAAPATAAPLPKTLPQTGSSLWLFGLLALVAPLGAFSLRLLRSQL